MSMIVRAKVDIELVDERILMKSLGHFGPVRKGNGGELVLRPPRWIGDMTFLSSAEGYREIRYDSDNLNAEDLKQRVQDRYLAEQYREELAGEGYDVEIRTLKSGALEVLATEEAW